MTVVLVAWVACSGAAHKRTSPVASPTLTPWVFASPTPPPTLQTQGVAPVPALPPQSLFGRPEAEHYRTLASRARTCRYAQAENAINGTLYVGCSEGNIVALDAHGNVLAAHRVEMDGINTIEPAGDDAIAVSGFNDGATLRSGLTILRARTLQPITANLMSDSTFLGVIGDRAYIDDWCCNGRPDVYQPATIYSISLKDGSESERVDLAPDPQAHPGNLQPLGQGEHNYLIGKYFYVVVGPVTYRYDVHDLQKPPKRMATPGTSP
ncbi:MAG: hypothetical protein ACXWNK_13205 [Vulcanimicrobiaceae bacterium]